METLSIPRPDSTILQIDAYPAYHHRYWHIPVIRVEHNGRLIGWGQFTTIGTKNIWMIFSFDNQFETTIRDQINAWVEKLMDKYPEAKPKIIRMKVTKAAKWRHVSEGDQKFLFENAGKLGVLDTGGDFHPLTPSEWEAVA